MQYLAIDKCKDGYLYRINARNASYGIYNEKKKSFTISRYKFGEVFLFHEDHWDTGAPHGTAKCLKEIEKAPEFNNDKEKLEYLDKFSDDEEYRSRINKRYGYTK